MYTAADQVVAPVLTDLMDCLSAQVAELPDPPAVVCIRQGDRITLGVSETEDECCNGLGWVRFSQMVPSADSPAPARDVRLTSCHPMRWDVTVELGIARCAPTGNAQSLPTCEQHTDLAMMSCDDLMALRNTAACYSEYMKTSNHRSGTVFYEQGLPLGVSGACSSVALIIRVMSLACDPDPQEKP